MKKIGTTILTCALLSGMISCNESDFLDLNNPNNATTEDFWKSEKDAVAAMATVYSPIRGQMYGYWGGFTGFQNMNVRADDTWALVDDPETWKITTFVNTPTSDRMDFDKMYKSIHRANVFLANVDNVPMEDAKKAEMTGEAKFLRAFNYFLLVTNFGEVPLRIKVVEGSEDAALASSSEADIWKQIEADLTDAMNALPVARPEKEKGRVEKGAAVAYLGKAYLYQQKYAEAEQLLATLMTTPYAYGLMDQYEHNFTPEFELNKESIFELCYAKFGSGSWGQEGVNDTQGVIIPQMIGTPLTGGWFKLMPTTAIVDEFMIEERPEGSDSKFDKRMYTSFFFKYSDFGDVKEDAKWYGSRYDMDQLWESTKGKRETGGAPDFTKFGGEKGRFLIKKFTSFYMDNKNGDSMYETTPIDNNLRVMRYAEVLLMYAEAATQNGNLAGANNALAQIRERAGLEAKTFASGNELIAEIMHQNMLEFYFEGHRFFDLKRWYNYEGMKAVLIENNKQGVDNFEPKHFVYPIPQGELNTNTAIKQNPLW
ncbi:MAG: RagB/SusD family nutrient uptake outer membrane protein [Tannerellaceae bacterium]